ncbi:MAG: ribosome-associated translation inhibitor RaiA [Candidatus Saccharimonadales bacterium]|nr:ribosome-associated translation inhibitor RaiA [Candidatus Saccharimonadales bacterium]
MIANVEITGIHLDLDADLEKYARNKVSKLDRYMPRSARRSVRAEVKLIQDKSNKKNKNTCEVVLHLPGREHTAKESTINMYAAIDIVETKLKNQLRKYKDQHANHRAPRKEVLRKFRRMADRDFWGRQN